MAKRDIIVVGGSAGALEALSTIVAKLPHDLAASIFVVLHMSPTSKSMLPQILTRAGRLQAIQAADKQSIEKNLIYLAPPDRHLMLENRHVVTIHGPKENRARPAVDPLFRSAAVNYGPRVVGVILSGALDDGTAGLRAIKRMGGVAIVQDPAEATYPAMPQSAIDNNSVDHIVPVAEIPRLLRSLVQQDVEEEGGNEAVKDALEKEVDVIKQEFESPEMIYTVKELGRLSMFTCPECHGALWELQDDELLRYRCHVGHAFSIDSLDAEHSEKLEGALWSALRALEERGAMARHLAKQARERERDAIAIRFEQRATEADEHAESIRKMLLADPEKMLTAPSTNPEPVAARD